MDNHAMQIDKDLDASGLACPMPIVKSKKALATLTSGQVLRVWSTDPGSKADMPVFAEHGGHTLVDQGEVGGRWYFLIRKA
jgi:tRNA 2-thiouridine synthesizing protein A